MLSDEGLRTENKVSGSDSFTVRQVNARIELKCIIKGFYEKIKQHLVHSFDICTCVCNNILAVWSVLGCTTAQHGVGVMLHYNLNVP